MVEPPVRSQTLLSLTLTRKNGEAFDQRNVSAIAQTASDLPLHQMRAQNLSVAGFETRDYLGYAVSGLDQSNHLQLAVALAPAVRDWLARY